MPVKPSINHLPKEILNHLSKNTLGEIGPKFTPNTKESQIPSNVRDQILNVQGTEKLNNRGKEEFSKLANKVIPGITFNPEMTKARVPINSPKAQDQMKDFQKKFLESDGSHEYINEKGVEAIKNEWKEQVGAKE